MDGRSKDESCRAAQLSGTVALLERPIMRTELSPSYFTHTRTRLALPPRPSTASGFGSLHSRDSRRVESLPLRLNQHTPKILNRPIYPR